LVAASAARLVVCTPKKSAAGLDAIYSRRWKGCNGWGGRGAAFRYAPGATVCGAGMQMTLR